MNILFLSPWLPWPPFGGARSRILETLRYLSRQHRVTLLATVRHPAEANHESALDGLCEKIVIAHLSDQTSPVLRRLCMGLVQRRPFIESFHYDRQLARKVTELTSQESYDVIHVEFPFLAPYLDAVSPDSRAKKVLSMHNVESIRLAREPAGCSSMGRQLVLQGDRFLFASWEKRAIRKFDGITAVSTVERDWIRQHAPGAKVEMVSNGVDTKYFHPVETASESRSLVFTGLMDYPPNVDAVIWFCNEIFPQLRRRIPDISLKIVGSSPHPRISKLGNREAVHIVGAAPDMRPYLAQSSALVVPLRSGGGTRLKILEAMAMARPVVSTTLGAEGLDVTPDVNILIADTPEQFIHHILLLISSPELADRLGQAGRRLVVEKYDWSLCLRQLESLYDTLLRNQSFSEATVAEREPVLET
jgi:sugar transferase (PEP-CTERM/EpsH1 system associated)